MKVVIGGKVFENFTGGSVTSHLNAISRSFTLEATTREVKDIPFRKGHTVEISIEDRKGEFERIFNGYIEKISMAGSESDVQYTISGRDRMADVVDSNLDGLPDVGATVVHACRVVLAHLGIKRKVIDLANTRSRPFERALDIVSPEPTDTAGEFLKSIAQRRQALLTSDGDANLVVTEGIGFAIESTLTNRIDQEGNNILSFRYETDDSQRYGIYTTDSQLNVAAIGQTGGSAPNAAQIVSTTAGLKDPSLRASRRRAIASESSYPTSDALKRAQWEANLSRAEGTIYSVVKNGFLDDDGNVWKVNTSPLVVDEFAGIQGRRLIRSIVYRFGGDGETTDLNLTELGAFRASLKPRVVEEEKLGASIPDPEPVTDADLRDLNIILET